MRSVYFLGVFLVGILFPWWILVCVALLYAFRFKAYELIPLAVLFDASFGLHTLRIPFPLWYTLGACLVVVLMGYFRPLLPQMFRP